MTDDFGEKLNRILSNPTMMAQIKSLADTMTENHAPNEIRKEEPPPALSIPEKAAVPAFFTPSSTFEKNMKNTCALLTALKPFLDENRCAKVDKMLSMIHFAQMAGQLGQFF